MLEPRDLLGALGEILAHHLDQLVVFGISCAELCLYLCYVELLVEGVCLMYRELHILDGDGCWYSFDKRS